MNKFFDNWKKNVPLSIRSNKANPFQAVQGQFDKALSDFYSLLESPSFSMINFEDLSLSPSIDIVEDEKAFKIECEMPGMSEEDIQVEIKEGMLCIKGEKETSKKDKEKNYLLREISYGSYERNILLPDNIDIDHATASFKKGMLWVVIPKQADKQSVSHAIKVENVKEEDKGLLKEKTFNLGRDNKEKR